jgi:hypothetical protein
MMTMARMEGHCLGHWRFSWSDHLPDGRYRKSNACVDHRLRQAAPALSTEVVRLFVP